MSLYNVQPQFGSRILCIGDDPNLLHSRVMVLEHAGYPVHGCASPEAVPLIYRERFDLALICRSVSLEQGLTLARVIHSRWDTKVIRLAPRRGEEEWPFDFAIDTMKGPVRFLHTLAEVVNRGTSHNTPTRPAL